MVSDSKMKLRMDAPLACCVITCLFFVTSCKKKEAGGKAEQSSKGQTNAASVTTADSAVNTAGTARVDAVVFDKAGVSFVPDVEWSSVFTGSFASRQAVCLPVLEGIRTNKGCLIEVFCIEGDSRPKEAAHILEEMVDSDQNTIKHSFQHELFKTVDNVEVVRAWYEYKTKFYRRLRADVYFLQNRASKCVVIQHISFRDRNSVRVKQMIQDTLKLN